MSGNERGTLAVDEGASAKARARERPSTVTTRASYLVLKKSHIVPVAAAKGGAPSNQFEEKVSAVSGLPVLVDRERTPRDANSSRRLPRHQREQRLGKLWGAERRAHRRQNATQNQASFLRDRSYQRQNKRARAWRDASIKKWQALQLLHELRCAPEHRFAPPLDVAFSKAMPRFQVPMRVLRSAFVDNFALERDHRQQAMEALELCFQALDDDGDMLVDWRELLCHLEVLYMPRRLLRERLRAMFRSLSDHRHLLTLDRFWAMMSTFALPHQRDLLAGALWPVVATLVHSPRAVIVADDADASRLLDNLRIFQRQRWAEGLEDPLDERIFASPCGDDSDESCSALAMATYAMKPGPADLSWIRAAAQVLLSEDAMLQAVFTPAPSGSAANLAGAALQVKGPSAAELHTLRVLLQKLAWDRLAPETRVRVRAERVDETHEAFERVNTKIRWIEARNFWRRVVKPHVLQTRFDTWKENAIRSIKKKQGAAFHMLRRKQLAMRQLGLHAERRAYDRWRNAAADRFSHRVHLAEALRLWKAAHARELRFQRVQIAKAQRLYGTWQLERILHGWHREARTRRRFRRIRAGWQRRIAGKMFSTWRDNVRTIVEKRAFEEERSRLRQQILAEELEEVDQKIAEIRAQEAEEERERQEALEQERLAALAEEQRWERERERAFAGYERRTILKHQEKKRASHKATILRGEENKIEITFAAVMKKAVEDAKREAETFARTRAGKEQLERDAEKIQNDADRLARTKGGAAGAPENEDGAEWKKMYDPVFQSYFFYNPETGEKVTAAALSLEEAMSIARTNYVSNMVQAAKDEVERCKEAEIHKKRLIWAGRKVQAAWRVRKARMAVHELIRAVYMKRVDPYTGTMYYYNTQTRKSSWTKPLNLGPRKDLRPPEWVVRCDADGQWSYQNNVTPWIGGIQKPAGYLPCLTCSLQLAIVRCDTCAHHYCLDCFEAAHPLPVTHTVARKPYGRLVKDSPETCIMCKKEVASKFCIECGLLDFYCSRCYTMSHAKNPNRPHQLSAKQKHAPALDM